MPSLLTFSVMPSFSTSASATSVIMASVNQELLPLMVGVLSSAGESVSSLVSVVSSVSSSVTVPSLPTYLPEMVKPLANWISSATAASYSSWSILP